MTSLLPTAELIAALTQAELDETFVGAVWVRAKDAAEHRARCCTSSAGCGATTRAPRGPGTGVHRHLVSVRTAPARVRTRSFSLPYTVVDVLLGDGRPDL